MRYMWISLRAFCAALLYVLRRNTMYHLLGQIVFFIKKKPTPCLLICRQPFYFGRKGHVIIYVRCVWFVVQNWCTCTERLIAFASHLLVSLFLRSWSCAITSWWPNWTNTSRTILPSVAIIRPSLTHPECKSLKTHGKMLALHVFWHAMFPK